MSDTCFTYFLNCIWQVPLLVATASAVLRMAKLSVRQQHRLWVATLAVCVLVPLAGTRHDIGATVSVTYGRIVPIMAAQQPTVFRWPTLHSHVSAAIRDNVAILYGLLVLLGAIRLLLSQISAQRLIAQSQPCRLTSSQHAMLAELTTQMHTPPFAIRRLPGGDCSPLVAGVLHPVLLLPGWLLEAEPDQLRAALAHELAHLTRRDPAANLCLRLLALPIHFHPATVVLGRRIRHTREMLVDNAAAAACSTLDPRSPNLYAHSLIELARRLVGPEPPALHSALGLLERTSHLLLEERIMNLVTKPVSLPISSRIARLTAAALVSTAAAALLSHVHLVPEVFAAQTTAPAPVSAVPASPEAQQNADAVIPGPAASTTRAGKRAIPQTTPLIDQAALQKITQQAVQAQLQSAQVEANVQQQMQALTSLRLKLESLSFQQQTSRMQAEAAKMAKDSVALQLEGARLREQFNGPEMQKLLAEVKPLEALRMTTSMQNGDPLKLSSETMATNILHKVPPVYPPQAKAAKITGSVVLAAVIGKDGSMQSLHVLSGPEELRGSALEAVRQWTYNPYLLNGEPTEVETTITITYSMG